MNKNFTAYCKPLIAYIQELRKVIFLGRKQWLNKNRKLYSRMKSVLEKVRNHLDIAAIR